MKKLILLIALIIPLNLTADNEPDLFTNSLVPESAVRLVYFYSPTCPLCHDVMEELLPMLREIHGRDLTIMELNIDDPAITPLFNNLVKQHFPDMMAGAPAAAIGETLLLGKSELFERLPALIDTGLADGGLDWPAIEGLAPFIDSFDPLAPPVSIKKNTRELFMQDPLGNSIATLVLLLLILTILKTITPQKWQARFNAPDWLFILVACLGLITAAYLSYVEITLKPAVCGPVGNCNIVQQSKYALIMGVIPTAVLGLIGYALILVTKLSAMRTRGRVHFMAQALTFGLCLFGLFASAFLTFLEPFVIGATCSWCLTSAICMAFMTVIKAGDGWSAIRALTGRN